jgi:hypothetical protein
MNINTMLPNVIELVGIFYENCALAKILSRDIFISVFIKDSHDEVCRQNYPYCICSTLYFPQKFCQQAKAFPVIGCGGP